MKAGLAGLLLTAALVGGLIAPATALASCAPGRNHAIGDWFDGWYNSEGTTNVGGIYSDILVYSPYVYDDSSYQGVSAWVMLVDSSAYAQVGWVQYPQGSRGFFDQWTTANGSSETGTVYYGVGTVGQYAWFTMLYNNPSGYFTFEYNDGGGNVVMNQPVAKWTPTGVQNYGEIVDAASQMPGGASDHEDFSSTYWYINGQGWIPMNGTPQTYYKDPNNGIGIQFEGSKYSSTDDQIWDSCPS
ncbi:MAG: hypothetical protein ABSE52_07625 [Candidatus Dormibacteria bacterium]|jgi:hypothetical protein